MKAKRFSISLSTLSVLAIVASAIAAVTICTIIFSTVYSRSLTRDAHVASEQAVSRAELAVNNYLDSVTNKLFLVSRVLSEVQTPQEAEARLSAFTMIQSDIYAITVYDADGRILSCIGSGGKRKASPLQDLSFNKKLFDSASSYSISKPHVQTLFENEYPWVVTVGAAVDTPVLGSGCYIAIDFMFSEIAQYIDGIGIGRRGYCFILDDCGEFIYHSQQQLLFSGLKSEDTAYLLSLPDGVTDAGHVIYTQKTTEITPWRIVGVTYTDELAAERRLQVFITILLSCLFCSCIILLVLFVYAKAVNAPVKALIRAMKDFETTAGKFTFSGGGEAVTEISVISRSFEHMSIQIQQLMERIRREEKELRKIELKALQAQINPHFLYNTLDSIQWMCEQDKTESAAKMVSALARLFRISISRGRELIPIRDELMHAKNYLVIQSFRYRDQFTYSFDVDTALEPYLCNKITIQPLIENAIYHGIDRLVDEGEIHVTVKQADDNPNDILIIVRDNGVGMTEAQCAAILQKGHSDSRGIGVKNVDDRLKIYFGEQYGITIQTELDVGTAVTVRIPKIEKEPEQNEEEK